MLTGSAYSVSGKVRREELAIREHRCPHSAICAIWVVAGTWRMIFIISEAMVTPSRGIVCKQPERRSQGRNRLHLAGTDCQLAGIDFVPLNET